MFSYGSGCAASFCVGQIQTGAEAFAGALCPQAELDRRRKLSIEDDEELARQGEQYANDMAVLHPESWGLTGDVFYRGTINHIRQYG